VSFLIDNSTIVRNKAAEAFGASAKSASSSPLTWDDAVAWLERVGDGHVHGAQSIVDGAIVFLSLFIAYRVRYDGAFTPAHILQFLFWAPILVPSRILLLRKLGIHRFLWRFVCFSDAIAIARSILPVSAALLLVRWLYPEGAPLAYWLRLPLGIIVPEFLLTLGGILAIRGICRVVHEHSDQASVHSGTCRKRVLLYGAGRAGVLLARELKGHCGIDIIGFIDDDEGKAGTVISGIRVLGGGDQLESIVRRGQLDEVMISIAAASTRALSRILARCKAIPVETRIIPSADEIVAGRVNISHLREIHIEDLLGRSTIASCEFGPYTRAAYRGKRVLVTGAGGSIGSELSRQLMLLKPARLAILDKDENSIYELERELQMRDPDMPVEPFIADMKLPERIAAVFQEFRPEVVLHAAAHKHVPLMEKNVCEAVLNNVMGLKHVLEASRCGDVERFVFISSDKAVNPSNVMGATKRVGEKLVSMYATGEGMKAASVRFGNVMGSRGSVIPLFKKQIENGGPVTVTHADIVRYFMTIPEAVQLVLRAGSLARSNEVFVLNMGNPRRVLDLARQMIKLAGLEPEKDIPITITGLRPGEKLAEELAAPGEALRETRFDKVFEIPPTRIDGETFQRDLVSLIAAARSGDSDAVIAQLVYMGLGYNPVSFIPQSSPRTCQNNLVQPDQAWQDEEILNGIEPLPTTLRDC
jgi:FlaA1/EpsC-like NDP-sugar epimerase